VPYGSAGRDVSGRRGPFRSFGEQLISIFNSGFPGGQVDPRLNILNATGLGTQFPSEGGFLVQTDFSTALLDRVQKTAVLFPKCWHIPIGPNADGVELPFIDETSRATGSRWGGVQVYRRNEADSVTAKKPKFGMIEVRLEDLMGLCYVTNRALKDAPSTGAIVSRAFEEEFAFRVDDEIIRGTGAGQATGILVSGSLVSVGKETGQLAKTIVYENLVKMYARMPIRNRVRAEWYYNQEIEPQLFTMGLTLGTGGAPVYMPGGGASASPYSTLFGRPMIPIEQASALGDVGDIIFADLNEYLIVEKGGMESEQSIHVRFIYDEMAFRFIMRNNGQPLWKTPLTPFKAAAGATLSPFVTLAQRA
jgi:HK97 family phage major capsid protein